MTQDSSSSDAASAPMPSVRAKRPAPPKVAPVVFDGMRFEQAGRALVPAGGQRTGYLVAYKGDTDERLWLLQVYAIEVIAHLERDVQEVYFASMAVLPATRQIAITNERGDRFLVDIDTRTVQQQR